MIVGEIYTFDAINEQILTERSMQSYVKAVADRLKSPEQVITLVNNLADRVRHRSRAEIAAYVFATMLAAGPVSTKLVKALESSSDTEISTVANKISDNPTTTIATKSEPKAEVEPEPEPEPEAEVEAELKPFETYLDTIAFEESSGNDRAVNQYGYMGKYQFGKLAIKDIAQWNSKFKHLLSLTPAEFKRNHEVFPVEEQDAAMKQLLKNNWHYIRAYHKYLGKEIDGIKLDVSGLLAGAHLVGNKSLAKWLKSNGAEDPKDRNGEHVSTYVRKFSGYEIPKDITNWQ